MNTKGEQKRITAFDVKYKRENDPEYPYLLASILNRTTEQLEETRAMKMLGDWIVDY